VFPAWHRAYLLDFEQALQKADVAAGGDGKIGLPYWDWQEFEVIPPIIRKHFSEIPAAFKEEIIAAGGDDFANRGYDLHSDSVIRRNLRGAKLTQKVNGVLSEPLHWRAASTRWGGGFSVETPHNDVHVATGFPMSTVKYEARNGGVATNSFSRPLTFSPRAQVRGFPPHFLPAPLQRGPHLRGLHR
jgi:hypothetical protein